MAASCSSAFSTLSSMSSLALVRSSCVTTTRGCLAATSTSVWKNWLDSHFLSSSSFSSGSAAFLKGGNSKTRREGGESEGLHTIHHKKKGKVGDVSSSFSSSSLQARAAAVQEELSYGEVFPLERKSRKALGFPQTYRRVGAVAMKCGMTREWDANGVAVPLTVLWLDENHVVQVKTEGKEGFWALQVGAGSKRHKRVNNSLIGHFRKHVGQKKTNSNANANANGNADDVVVSRKVVEFKVTENCLLEAGHAIHADHFVAGQFVDVQGTTKGKGFAGGMKRHGMKGGSASHGNTKAHRSIGSTGQCQDPGKVFKGKKMPGRMGGKTCSQQRLLVYKVDPVHNLLFIKGQVPGGKGSYVRVMDSKIAFQDVALPYPTRREDERQKEVKEVTTAYASTKNDPFTRYWQY